MLQMKCDYDWPAGLRDIYVLKCERTYRRMLGRWLKSNPISSLGAFGSGELIEHINRKLNTLKG